MLSCPASPAASPSPADKFELLEEEAVMQYQSSEDSIAERMQGLDQPEDSTTEQSTPRTRKPKVSLTKIS